MVETKNQTVYMAVVDGAYVGEFPTMEGALYCEARVKFEKLMNKYCLRGEIAEDDVCGFLLDNRDAVREWLNAYDRYIVMPRPQHKPASPQLCTPDMDEGRNGR